MDDRLTYELKETETRTDYLPFQERRDPSVIGEHDAYARCRLAVSLVLEDRMVGIWST